MISERLIAHEFVLTSLNADYRINQSDVMVGDLP